MEERFDKIDTRMVTDRLKDEVKKNEGMSPEMKKILQIHDLPRRLNAMLARQLYQCQPSFAMIESIY